MLRTVEAENMEEGSREEYSRFLPERSELDLIVWDSETPEDIVVLGTDVATGEKTNAFVKMKIRKPRTLWQLAKELFRA